MLILKFRQGDAVVIDLPGGEQAKIIFEPSGNFEGKSNIGFEFPKPYGISRVTADGKIAKKRI